MISNLENAAPTTDCAVYFLVLPIRENHAQGFSEVFEYEHENKIVRKNLTELCVEMIPDVTERVIKGGTELNLTCIVGPVLSSINENKNIISWQLPDGIISDQAVSSLFFLNFLFDFKLKKLILGPGIKKIQHKNYRSTRFIRKM